MRAKIQILTKDLPRITTSKNKSNFSVWIEEEILFSESVLSSVVPYCRVTNKPSKVLTQECESLYEFK